MEADEIYSKNYLESVKMAQKCVYAGFLISAFILLIIDLPKDNAGIKIPLINIDAQTPQAAIVILTALYFLNGLLVSFTTRNAVRNMQRIGSEDIRRALSHYPLTLASKGVFSIIVIVGLIGVNWIIFIDGFDLAWYFGATLGTLAAWGYWDAFYEAHKHLQST